MKFSVWMINARLKAEAQRAFFAEGCPNPSHTSANLAFLLISEELTEQKWNYVHANGCTPQAPLSPRVSGVQSWAGTKIH